MKYSLLFLFFVVGILSFLSASESRLTEKSLVYKEKEKAEETPPSISPKQKFQNLKRAFDCYESDSCDYPDSDPRDYSFHAAKEIAGELFLFLDDLRKNPDLLKDKEQDAETFAELAIKIPDGHVQSKALEIYSLLPPKRKHLENMMEGLRNTPDPLLIEQAMRVWKKYLGTADEEKIQEFLSHLMAHGAQFSSERASEEIMDFLNERSEPLFQEALAKMPKDSTPARNLKAALLQYHSLRSGG